MRWMVLCTVLAMAGCQQEEILTPVMTDSLYQAVLIDLHLAAGRAEVVDTSTYYLKDSIFSAHNISEGDYEQMTEFLLQNPTRHEKILSDALDELGRERFLGQ